MRTGTNHFWTLDHAIRYYSNCGISKEEVLNKWKNLEICIGKPNLKKGEDYSIDKDGRYWIQETVPCPL